MINRRVMKRLFSVLAGLVLPLHSMPPIRPIGHAQTYTPTPSRHSGVAAAKRLAKKRRKAKKP